MSARSNLRGYLSAWLEPQGDGTNLGHLFIGPHTRTTTGDVSIGAVATMVDVEAVVRASGSHPAPLVTSHIAIRLPASPADGLMRAESSVVRSGRASVVSLSRIYDSTGSLVGSASVSAGALAGGGSSHGGSTKEPNSKGPADDARRIQEGFYQRTEPPPDALPLDAVLALSAVATESIGGHESRLYRMPFHEVLRNVNSVLHGGGACLLAEMSARHAASDRGLVRAHVDSLDVHYLLPGTTGPFLARVVTLAGAHGRHSMTVEMLDEGRDSRVFGLALVGLGPA